MKKLVLIGAGSLLLVAIGWKIVTKTAAPSGRRGGRGAIVVQAGNLAREDIVRSKSFEGSLHAGSYVIVAPKVSGRLEQLTVDIGDAVTRGQTVAVLDDDEFTEIVEQTSAELDVARASLLQAESALGIAEEEYSRIKRLLDKKIASIAERDTSKAQFDVQRARSQMARAEVKRRTAALKAARVRLRYTKIVVSWEGGGDRRFVGERFVDEGAMLSANTRVVSIVDLDTLIAVVDVDEKDYKDVAVGRTVEVFAVAYPNEVFPGTIERVAPILNVESRHARVEVTVANADGRLKPGMSVEARVELAPKPGAQVARRDWLFWMGDEQGLYTVDSEGVARFVAVEQRVIDAERVEILSPVIDAPVVTRGHPDLADGKKVTVVASPAEKPE